jgi:hypothetical protein
MSELKQIPGLPPRQLAQATPSPDYFAARATAENSVRLRGEQLGRTYATPEDARAAWIIESTLMALAPCQSTTRLDAPQTQPKSPEVSAFAAVEKALTLGGDEPAIQKAPPPPAKNAERSRGAEGY